VAHEQLCDQFAKARMIIHLTGKEDWTDTSGNAFLSPQAKLPENSSQNSSKVWVVPDFKRLFKLYQIDTITERNK